MKVLVKKKMATAELFINPELGIEIPKNLAGDQAAAWAIKNGGYVYNFKPGLDANKLDANTVVLYERVRQDAKGINIVYGDGHVSFHELAEGVKILKKAGIQVPGF